MSLSRRTGALFAKPLQIIDKAQEKILLQHLHLGIFNISRGNGSIDAGILFQQVVDRQAQKRLPVLEQLVIDGHIPHGNAFGKAGRCAAVVMVLQVIFQDQPFGPVEKHIHGKRFGNIFRWLCLLNGIPAVVIPYYKSGHEGDQFFKSIAETDALRQTVGPGDVLNFIGERNIPVEVAIVTERNA